MPVIKSQLPWSQTNVRSDILSDIQGVCISTVHSMGFDIVVKLFFNGMGVLFLVFKLDF